MDCSLEVVANVFERLGLPVALLVVLVYSLYRGAGWLAPRIENYLTSSMASMTARNENNERVSVELLAGQRAIQDILHQLMHSQSQPTNVNLKD